MIYHCLEKFPRVGAAPAGAPRVIAPLKISTVFDPTFSSSKE